MASGVIEKTTPQTEGRGRMPERLGLGIIGIVPGIGWRASEIRAIARQAEDAGFDAIVTTEANSDSLATAQLIGEATQQIKVGTLVSSIYMRHSYVCAKAASLLTRLSNM
jgi:alkanesulfonate monooxygenase SsuD/methylene tetrahydromethanopterin reductase-like flavin-dependent oxidoreductase (luciferase family)